MGVGGPGADRPVGAPPASARSARAKSAGGPGALERASSPAGGENFDILAEVCSGPKVVGGEVNVREAENRGGLTCRIFLRKIRIMAENSNFCAKIRFFLYFEAGNRSENFFRFEPIATVHKSVDSKNFSN